MRTNAKNINALFLLCLFLSSEYKSIKLGIIPDDIKFKHIYMETSHIYI